MGVLEVAGIASIMPFMAVVANPSVIQTNPHLSRSYHAFAFHSQTSFLLFLGFAVLGIIVVSNLYSALANWFLLHFTHQCGAPGSQPYVPVHGEGRLTEQFVHG